MTTKDVLTEDMRTTRQIAAACLAGLEHLQAGQARSAVLDDHARDVLRAASGLRGRLQALQAACEQDAGEAATPEARQIAKCAAELCRLALPMASNGSSRSESGFRRLAGEVAEVAPSPYGPPRP